MDICDNIFYIHMNTSPERKRKRTKEPLPTTLLENISGVVEDIFGCVADTQIVGATQTYRVSLGPSVSPTLNIKSLGDLTLSLTEKCSSDIVIESIEFFVDGARLSIEMELMNLPDDLRRGHGLRAKFGHCNDWMTTVGQLEFLHDAPAVEKQIKQFMKWCDMKVLTYDQERRVLYFVPNEGKALPLHAVTLMNMQCVLQYQVSPLMCFYSECFFAWNTSSLPQPVTKHPWCFELHFKGTFFDDLTFDDL